MGSVTESIAVPFGVPYQLSSQLCAPVQAFPGTRIKFAEPVARIALIATWAESRHCSVGIVFGSFIRSKMTRLFDLYLLASRVQKSAKALFGTAAEPISVSVPMGSPPTQ